MTTFNLLSQTTSVEQLLESIIGALDLLPEGVGKQDLISKIKVFESTVCLISWSFPDIDVAEDHIDVEPLTDEQKCEVLEVMSNLYECSDHDWRHLEEAIQVIRGE